MAKMMCLNASIGQGWARGCAGGKMGQLTTRNRIANISDAPFYASNLKGKVKVSDMSIQPEQGCCTAVSHGKE
jgi:hypothetical protein